MSYCLLSENVKLKTDKIILLPVILYGCETRSLTLRKEQAEGVLIQGAEETVWPKREEVTRLWRQLNSDEPHDLY